MGKKIGDTVQCGYHGMVFGENGACVLNPHHGGVISPAMKVACLSSAGATRRNLGLDGRADAADASLIPDLAAISAPGFKTIRGMMDVAANYELITDNLLDLTHADFLHEGTLSSEAITVSKLETIEQGSTVWANRWCPDGIAPPVWGQLLNSSSGSISDPDRSLVVYALGCASAYAARRRDLRSWQDARRRRLGLYRPSSNPRQPDADDLLLDGLHNHGIENPDVAAFWQGSIDYAFAIQDKPMIEAQQAAIGSVT